MAYPKITVNTGKALAVIASDTIPIPSPDCPEISGTNGTTQNGKLVDSSKDFITAGVEVGDIVYNTSDNTSATVSAIDSASLLTLSANIMASGEAYTIFLNGPIFDQRIQSSSGCLLYVGSSEATMTVATSFVDVKVKTVDGSIVTFSNFPVGEYLPVQVLQLYATGTDAAADNNCLAIW
ncbi:MAG TPA: hypothetical protein VLB82_11590 [Thermodesulfobacteriota bacterium]|jgi:hypothetical protein|nr:hypothetical protein [Thermodesulfobacteriota bacterium]